MGPWKPPSPFSKPLSWKVRYRTLLWFLSQMSKLYRARFSLYRRQILQQNIRWKALDEINKIYTLLHRSDLNISEMFRQTFSHFLAILNSLFLNSFRWFLLRFDEILSDFEKKKKKIFLSELRRSSSRYFRKCWKFLKFLNFLEKILEFWKWILVGKLLTRPTRFTCFCTAQTSMFQQNFVNLFLAFSKLQMLKSSIFSKYRRDFRWFSWNLLGFSKIFSKNAATTRNFSISISFYHDLI